MMRSRATWLVLAAIAAVLVAGVVDSVRSSSSTSEASQAGQSVVQPSTTSRVAGEVATDAENLSEPLASTEPADEMATDEGSAKHRGLPSCDTDQLHLSFAPGGEGLMAAVVRRVKGKPCHQDRQTIRFRVRNQSRDFVAVFGGTQATWPTDFRGGFAELVEIPQLSCDPRESFLVVATVGPYTARRTLVGSQLPCNHG